MKTRFLAALSTLPLFLPLAAACSAAPTDEPLATAGEALTKKPLVNPPETTALDAFAGDFDGDGNYDVARWQPSAGNLWNVALSCGADLKPQFWGGDWGSDGPIHLGDLNGDGKSDLFMWRGSNNDWTVNLSTGTGFSPALWYGAWGSDGPNFVGDLNGDGKSDVFMWRASNNDWTVNLSTGSGFRAASWTGAWGSDGPIHIGDLNGDGKTDVFMWRDADKVWTVNLSTGSGWNAQIWHGDWGSDGPIHVGDLNGDGKTDVFMWRDADKVWTVNLSTGSGWNAQIWHGDWGSDGPINVGDLNGDGKSDVFMWRGDVWTVNLSTGSGFNAYAWNGAWGSDGPIHVADVNGDHKADVIMHRSDDTWSVNVSTGSGFNGASWTSEPLGTPTIRSLTTSTPAVPANGEIDVTYDVAVPAGCKLAGSWAGIDPKTGYGYSGYMGFTPDPSGHGTIGTSGWPVPLDMRFLFTCATTDACYAHGGQGSATGDVQIVLPPHPTIASFTISPQDGSPQYGYQCYGLDQTFNWNVTFPGSQCTKHAVTISATDDDSGNKQFFVAKDLAASGTLVHKANTDAHYTLVATCLDDGQSVSQTIKAAIAPATACSTGGGSSGGGGTKPPQGSTFCFKAVGKASQICSTDAIYQDTMAHAKAEFEQQFPPSEYDESSIDCSAVITACPDLTWP